MREGEPAWRRQMRAACRGRRTERACSAQPRSERQVRKPRQKAGQGRGAPGGRCCNSPRARYGWTQERRGRPHLPVLLHLVHVDGGQHGQRLADGLGHPGPPHLPAASVVCGLWQGLGRRHLLGDAPHYVNGLEGVFRQLNLQICTRTAWMRVYGSAGGRYGREGAQWKGESLGGSCQLLLGMAASHPHIHGGLNKCSCLGTEQRACPRGSTG